MLLIPKISRVVQAVQHTERSPFKESLVYFEVRCSVGLGSPLYGSKILLELVCFNLRGWFAFALHGFLKEIVESWYP